MKKNLAVFLIAMIILSISLIFDSTIISFINKIRTPAIDVFFSWILLIEQELIFYPVVIGLTLMVLLLQRDNIKIVNYLVSLVIAVSLVFLLKGIIARPRPNIPPNALKDSFPSGHTTLLFTSVPFFSKGLKIGWVVVSALLILARVWTGLHYLGDVIAGAILGYFIPFLAQYLIKGFEISVRRERKSKKSRQGKKR